MAKKTSSTQGTWGGFSSLFGSLASQSKSPSKGKAKASGAKKTSTAKSEPKGKAASTDKTAKGKSASTTPAASSTKTTGKTTVGSTARKAASKTATKGVKTSPSHSTGATPALPPTNTAGRNLSEEPLEQTFTKEPSAFPVPTASPSPAKPLDGIQVIMNEQSELALRLLKDSLGDILRPLEKIEELSSQITALQEEVQSLSSQLNSLRTEFDDSLEEIKQSVRHKAANSEKENR